MKYAYPLKEATPLPGFKVKAVFSDGTEGVADLSWVLEHEGYKTIHDPEAFASQMKLLEDGTIEWAEDIDASWEDIYYQITGKHPSHARPPDTRKRIALTRAEFTKPPDVYVEFTDGTAGELMLSEFGTDEDYRSRTGQPSNIMAIDITPWDDIVWNGTVYDASAMYHSLTGVDIEIAEKELNR